MVWRNRQLGFNAVRLPFNFYYLDKPMEDYTVPCNVTSRDDLIAGVTPPNVSTAGKRPYSEPPVIEDETCNADMPDTYFERLVWSICYLTSQDMYVAIDHHLDYSQRDNTSTWGWRGDGVYTRMIHPPPSLHCTQLRRAAAQPDPICGKLQNPRERGGCTQLLP